MAITQDELQSIVSAVLSAIRTNSRTIDQLTPVTELSDDDCWEINGGKKVPYKVINDKIEQEVTDREEAVSSLEKRLLGTISISDLDNITRVEAMASVLGKGPFLYHVTDNNRIVGQLLVISDEMGHVYTHVLVTHRIINDAGQLTNSHSDKDTYIYSRSFGISSSATIPQEEWTPWKKLQAELVQQKGQSETVAMSQKAVTDELNLLAAAIESAVTELAGNITAETEAREKADAAILGSVDIDDLDSVTVSQGMAAVLGRGPHRYNVMDDGKVVGTLEVLGDEMLHVFSQVLTTHRLIEDGKLASSHRDDRVITYYRSMGLRDSGVVAPGEWTRWRRSGGGNAEMAVEIDPDTGDVVLLYDDDGELPLADAYINERGEIVFNFEF